MARSPNVEERVASDGAAGSGVVSAVVARHRPNSRQASTHRDHCVRRVADERSLGRIIARRIARTRLCRRQESDHRTPLRRGQRGTHAGDRRRVGRAETRRDRDDLHAEHPGHAQGKPDYVPGDGGRLRPGRPGTHHQLLPAGREHHRTRQSVRGHCRQDAGAVARGGARRLARRGGLQRQESGAPDIPARAGECGASPRCPPGARGSRADDRPSGNLCRHGARWHCIGPGPAGRSGADPPSSQPGRAGGQASDAVVLRPARGGGGWRSDELRREHRAELPPRRLLRGQDHQRRRSGRCYRSSNPPSSSSWSISGQPGRSASCCRHRSCCAPTWSFHDATRNGHPPPRPRAPRRGVH